jgi:aryl-alcohol dehydrogenase-like predicted oxidoreductase
MKYQTLADGSLRVSALCLGTMTWGEQNTEAEAHDQLDFALASGINFIDTAEMYPVPPGPATQGRTEEYLGSWLVKAPRERVIIASKVAGPGRRDWVRAGRTELTRDNIHEACDGSLRRLRTDYLDLYQIHWPERNVPLFGRARFDPSRERKATPMLEQVQAMDELVRAGKIRHWGISNETAWGVCEFSRLAREHGLARPVSIQNCYNLLTRNFEWDLAEASFRERVPLLAYSPLAMGVLTGKYHEGIRPANARLTLFPAFGERYRRETVVAAAAKYAAIARRRGMTPAQLAIAFAHNRWFAASTIIGATSLNQLAECLGAADTGIDDALMEEIDAVHAQFTSPASGL